MLLAWTLGSSCFGLGDLSVAILVFDVGCGVVIGRLLLACRHTLLFCDRLNLRLVLLKKANVITYSNNT